MASLNCTMCLKKRPQTVRSLEFKSTALASHYPFVSQTITAKETAQSKWSTFIQQRYLNVATANKVLKVIYSALKAL